MIPNTWGLTRTARTIPMMINSIDSSMRRLVPDGAKRRTRSPAQ